MTTIKLTGDRRLGEGKSNFHLGARMFYVWLVQTLALVIGLTICLALVRDLGGLFTTGELRMLVAGAAVSYSVFSYRLMKKKEGWIARAGQLEREIIRLRALAPPGQEMVKGSPRVRS